jgi:hypothetical protein
MGRTLETDLAVAPGRGWAQRPRHFRRVPVFCDLRLTSSCFAAHVSGTLAGGARCQDGSARPVCQGTVLSG